MTTKVSDCYMTLESRSNIPKLCLNALNANSSYILMMNGVHILHSDSLLCLDDNGLFGSTILHWSQRSRSNILKSYLWLVM